MWQKFKNKPILALAPMADVTDVSFRQMFAKYNKPDVLWTEFVSCDGMYHTAKKEGVETPEEAVKLKELLKEKKVEEYTPFDFFLKDLEYMENERPVVAQIFTGNPETMEWGAELCRRLGFDGVDINMGCPDRSIEKQKSGAYLMKDYTLAKELVSVAKRGAGEVPVSVKTRLGYNEDQLEEWLPELLSTGAECVTIHARTRKEMSKVPARWERVKRAVEIRDELGSKSLIFGNGDAMTREDVKEKCRDTGCDGVVVGRGAFGMGFDFVEGFTKTLTPKRRLELLLEHAELFEKLLPHKPFHIMKKHFKAYIEGFDGARELRTRLMEAGSVEELRKMVDL